MGSRSHEPVEPSNQLVGTPVPHPEDPGHGRRPGPPDPRPGGATRRPPRPQAGAGDRGRDPTTHPRAPMLRRQLLPSALLIVGVVALAPLATAMPPILGVMPTVIVWTVACLGGVAVHA